MEDDGLLFLVSPRPAPVIPHGNLFSCSFCPSSPAVDNDRYLSNGQEWSEKLQLRERTKFVRYSLDPVWDEEFTLPVRR